MSSAGPAGAGCLAPWCWPSVSAIDKAKIGHGGQPARAGEADGRAQTSEIPKLEKILTMRPLDKSTPHSAAR